MHIVFFGWIKACDPMRVGGCESVIRRLAVGLSRKGHTVAVVMYGAGDAHTLDEFFGDRVVLKYHRFFVDALRELARLKSDVVVEAYIHKRYYAMYLAFKCWYNKTTKFFALVMASTGSDLKYWLCTRFRTMACSTVFAVSQNSARRLRDNGVPAVWLPPPVPDDYFTSPDRTSRGTKVVVSFLGRIDPNKGLYELASAFDAISQRSQFDLRVKGYYIPENPESVQLHTILQGLGGIDYSVEPYGSSWYEPSKEREILHYLSETDILVLPYRNLEGTLELPLIVLEGLVAGCLVISRDVGGISNILTHRDSIIDDPEKLGERLKKFTTLKAVKAQRAQMETSELFSTFAATKVVEQLLEYF